MWLYPFHIFNAISIYLESLEIILPQTILSMAFILLNFPLYYLFVFSFDLGIIGAAWASVISNIAQLASLVYYIWGPGIHLQEIQDTWSGWSYECLNWRRAWIFIRLGFPLGFVDILHDWIFQVLTIVAGTFGTVSVAAVGVMINMLLLLTPFLQSFSFATQIRVQIRLGKDRI